MTPGQSRRGQPHREPLSVRLPPELLAATDKLAAAHRTTRSAIVEQALQRFVAPPPGEAQRERTLMAMLVRVERRLARHDDYVRRTLVVLQEMLGLFVRAYYNHTPRVPPGERAAFRAAGKARFESFVEALAEHCGPGRSMLDQVPAWQRAANEPAADDAKPDREAADDADSINDA